MPIKQKIQRLNSMPALSFELGAIFLFCALLMYGTMSGFLPRLRVSPAIAIALTLLGLLAAAWRWSPWLDLSLPNGFWRASPAPVSASRPSPASTPVPQPKATKAVQRIEVWHTTVVEAVPQPVPPLTQTPAIPPQRTKSDGSSPYDSKVKRAAKSVGRFFSPTN
jgi:hypothetical protein